MNISIIGSGYVGMVTGTCFADQGHKVVFVDIDDEKIATINAGKSPIFEKGLSDLLLKNIDRISATNDYSKAVSETDVTFICVGTPPTPDGSIDLTYIKSAASSLGCVLKNKITPHVIIVKSTVFPGTTEDVIRPILERESGKQAYRDFGLGSNPEFLREGVAVEDFFNPDRIVIGENDELAKNVLEELYTLFNCPKVITDIKTAEMIKYASNAFLATKISFANEIGNLCKKISIDTQDVFEGVGLDARINPAFFRSGIGFGGSCFPKDVKALIAGARHFGQDMTILRSVIDVNDEQPLKAVELLKKHLPDLKGKTIGILGLAFKPDTDDIRESRSFELIDQLMREGTYIIAYDPMAVEAMRKIIPMIQYASAPDEVLKADAIIISTEWEEFEHLNYSDKIVIDGRRIKKAMKEAAIYEGVCW